MRVPSPAASTTADRRRSGIDRILSPPGRARYGTLADVPKMVPYDEFGLFHENASEYDIPYAGTA